MLDPQWLMAAFTGGILIFTAGLFFWQKWGFDHQKRVNNANYKLTLFDKRMEIYNAIEECLHAFMRDGDVPPERIQEMRWKCRNASFLFPDAPLGFLGEIINNGLDHYIARRQFEPLRARAFDGEDLDPEEDAVREAAVSEMHEIEKWFARQYQQGRLKEEFGPYLKLPETL